MAASATDSGNKDREIRKQLIQTGHVDCLMSVANNFFYKVSLPCSLWFFDKGKKEELKDKVLFIDSRNYYTVVDRTLNEWSEWQMKNLNAIVWLYRGEKEKYTKLLQDYSTQIINDCKELDAAFESVSVLLNGYGEKLKPLQVQVADIIKNAEDINQLLPLNDMLKKYIKELNASLKALFEYGDGLEKEEAKEFAKSIDESATTWDRFKKSVSASLEEVVSQIRACRTVIKEAKWLTEKFGEGTYTDVLGLCKVATIAEIEGKNWSLTPGAYVGVAPVQEDDENFEERMTEIHKELLTLQAEANQLMDTISANFEGVGNMTINRYILSSEFCESVRDGTHDTPKQTNSGYRLVTSKHIKNGQINSDEGYFISEKDFKKINERSLVDQWDVLMSMIGTIGEAAIVKDQPKYAIKNVALFKCGDELKAKWLYYFLCSPEGKGQLFSNQKGASQQFVSLTQLRNLQIPIRDQSTMKKNHRHSLRLR
jgi:cob(I)alamin adenosyltransferase